MARVADRAAPERAAACRQRDVVEFLSEAGAFGRQERTVERIDTHAAIVFLVDDRAYKLKRAVRYSFLDFSTLDKRLAALREELRLNRRTAPQLYRRLLPVTRDARGHLAVDGPGTPVEWLLEMVRFDQRALFDHLAEQGRLDRRLMAALAEVVADLHRTAEVRSRGGHLAMSRIVDGNADDLTAVSAAVGRPERIATLLERTRAELGRRRGLLDERCRNGFVRHCHGDLHLGNIVLIEGRPVLFDCLEFDQALASIDLVYDLAFLLMDLCRRGLEDLAIVLFNAYLDQTWDDAGSALLPLFLAIRATIRAKIEGFEMATANSDDDRCGHREAARRYLDLALDLLSVEPPRLIAIGGLSGSGKSTVARHLAEGLGVGHWPVVLRSDLIRKRLHGVAPTRRLGEQAYRPATSAHVYRTLRRRAATLLEAGRTVIADATFLNPTERREIEALARACSVPFHGIWLDAPSDVLTTRIAARRGDASDASIAVLRKQLEQTPGVVTWSKVDAGGAGSRVMAHVRRLLPDRSDSKE